MNRRIIVWGMGLFLLLGGERLLSASLSLKIIVVSPLEPGVGGEVENSTGTAKVIIDPDDLAQPTGIYIKEPDPQDEDLIEEVNQKGAQFKIPQLAGSVSKFLSTVNSFKNPVEIRLYYSDQDQDGFLDGTSIEEGKLNIYFLNVEVSPPFWEPLSGTWVEGEENYVAGEVTHFSILRLAPSSPPSGLGSLRVYPNPFKPNDGRESTGTWKKGIIFDQIPENSTILIFSLAGELVRKGKASGLGKWVWDGRNEKGEKVSSGIYLWLVSSENERKTGKLAIIK